MQLKQIHRYFCIFECPKQAMLAQLVAQRIADPALTLKL